MKKSRLFPNWRNQLYIVFRAERDRRLATSKRLNPLSTILPASDTKTETAFFEGRNPAAREVWQQKAGTISESIAWTATTWAKVTSNKKKTARGTNITRDFLRPEKIEPPTNSVPIAVAMGPELRADALQRSSNSLSSAGQRLGYLQLILISAASMPMDQSSFVLSASPLHLNIVFGSIQLSQVGTGTNMFPVRSSNSEATESRQYPSRNIYRKTPSSSATRTEPTRTTATTFRRLSTSGPYDKEKLEAWDWQGIPLNKESMRKSADKETIQYRAFEQLQAEYDVVFNDDGCGEAGDLVCLKDIDETTIRLCLVHCKGAHGGRVSQDIRNFYTLCGQAQKSITVKHAGLLTLYHDLKRRQEIWVREGKTRFLRGDMKKLSYFKEKARRSKLEFEVVLVQPGASVASITDDCLRLLATTEVYLLKTTQAKMRVVLSA